MANYTNHITRDITGQRFGYLVAIHPTDKRQSNCVVWKFQCDCGAICFKGVNNVATGNSISCGCMRKLMLSARTKTHGQRNTKLWHVWASMKQRCCNPKSRDYKNYGGRGITVCERWLHDFAAFVEDMGPRPIGGTVERIDNDGLYSPENCRWATQREQCLNRRPVSRERASERVKLGWLHRNR